MMNSPILEKRGLIAIMAFLQLVLLIVFVQVCSAQNSIGEETEPGSKSDSNRQYAPGYYALTHKIYSEAAAESDGIWKGEHRKPIRFYNNLRDGIHVFGWHPYWDEDAANLYDYELLSIVSYYGYDFDPTSGEGLHPERWEHTSLVKNARNIDPTVKVLLTVFAYDNLDTFFSNPDAMIRLVDDVSKAVDDKGADGISLDFQDIPVNNAANYLALIKRFSEVLKPKGQLLTIVVPALPFKSNIPLAEISEFADYLIVMGYDFKGGTDDGVGPMSVLYETGDSTHYTIERSISEFTGDSLAISREKLILSLSWIGSLYKQSEDNSFKKIGYHSIKYFEEKIKEEIKEVIDTTTVKPVSRTRQFEYKLKSESETTFTFFYIDTTNFGIYLKWIEQDSLAGVGIWTLADAGFDRSIGVEYWNEIEKAYGRPPPSFKTYIIDPIVAFIWYELDNPNWSLILSTILFSLYVIIRFTIWKRDEVPDWLEKRAAFLPIIFIISLIITLLHDTWALSNFDGDDVSVRLGLFSIALGMLALICTGYYRLRMYRLKKRGLP